MNDDIYDLMKDLYPICRSITGEGVRKTLNIIQKIIPIQLHEVPSRENFNSWTVPKEWNIKDAYIKNSDGDIIVSFQNHNLHVLNYSVPIYKKNISFKELKSNLYYRSSELGAKQYKLFKFS